MGKDYMDLALRDPAFAALRGEMATDFGAEMDPVVLGGEGAHFGGVDAPNVLSNLEDADDFDPNALTSVPDDLMASFGGFGGLDDSEDDVFGGDYEPFGADAARMQPAQVQALVASAMRKSKGARLRKMLIDPNRESTVKIQRYSFSLNAPITAVGTAQAGLTAQGAPSTHFHPEDVATNIAQPGFVTITEGKVANVSWTVGGSTDAYVFNPISTSSRMSLPPLTPANQATVLANYTGMPIIGLTTYTGSFPFSVTFSGHATVAG